MFQAERDFVKTAKACLSTLADPNAPAPVDALDTLMTSAKSVKARAVMIAAERCRDYAMAAQVHNAFELRTLSRLCGQFEDGLLEIDTDADMSVPEEITAPAQDLAAPQTPDAQTLARTASDTLATVIDFADASAKSALKILSAHSQGASAAKVIAPRPAQKPVSLESLIAPVTSAALVSAHRAHKQVSLSYACENITIDSDVASALQSLLTALCDSLIDLSVRHPAARETAGLPATGQIALTATQTARGLTLDVFCDDQAVARNDLLSGPVACALKIYQSAGGDLDFKPGRASGVMLVLSCTDASTIRLKTPPARPARLEAMA